MVQVTQFIDRHEKKIGGVIGNSVPNYANLTFFLAQNFFQFKTVFRGLLYIILIHNHALYNYLEEELVGVDYCRRYTHLTLLWRN